MDSNSVFTVRTIVAMSEANFAAFSKEIKARRKEHARRAETAQREAEVTTRKLVSAGQHEAQAAWARENAKW